MWCLRCPVAHPTIWSGPSMLRAISSSAPHFARPPARQSAPVLLYSKHRQQVQLLDDSFAPGTASRSRVNGIPSDASEPRHTAHRNTLQRPASAPRRRPPAAAPAEPPQPPPHKPDASRQVQATDRVGWSTVALTEILPALHRGKITTARSAHFHIRAAPATSLPRPRPPPFPVEYLRKRPEAKIINFAFLATKAKVSKLATKRNHARRRLKAAVDLVVNGRRGAEDSSLSGSPDLVVDGVVYVAQVEKSVLDVAFPQLCKDVKRALVDIRKKEGGAGDMRPLTGPPKRRTPR